MKVVAAEFIRTELRATTACDGILGRFIPRHKGLPGALLPSGGPT